MTLYRCWLRNDAGIPMGWQSIRSDTDAGARKLALRLLRERPQIQNLQVWRNADLAFRLGRSHLKAESDSLME